MCFSANSYKLFFYMLVLGVVITAGIFMAAEPFDGNVPTGLSEKEISSILVIDPGHGGEDGGAVSVSGVYESVINLDIGLKMAAISRLAGYPCVLTRETNEISYPKDAATVAKRKLSDQKARLKLIAETQDAVLLSVHQNFYPHPSPHGPQSFFAQTEKSDVLGRLVQAAFNNALYAENRRVSTKVADNIYLMKNISCPAVLAECGFISNPAEAALLETPEYRLKVAVTLVGAYLQFTNDESI